MVEEQRPRAQRRRPPDIPPRGPFVQAAIFCERLLEEKDGILSAIRMTDRFMVGAVVVAEDGTVLAPEVVSPEDIRHVVLPNEITLWALLVIRYGRHRQACALRIRAHTPQGETHELGAAEVPYLPDKLGVNVRIELHMAVRLPGVHWFEVQLNGSTQTWVPVEIVSSEPVQRLLGQGAS